MSIFPYTPFPFNVTPASPLFQLTPIASSISRGWVPSCSTPECVPTASWSTNSVGAALSFQFWGWDISFDGNVNGNMNIELLRNGIKQIWSPSGDTLFRLYGQPSDQFYLHNITLRVLDASKDAKLTVNQARVNGSTLAAVDADFEANRWGIPSNDPRLIYSGFSQRKDSVTQNLQGVYTSSRVGDTVSMRFNASACLIYGPCGPASGLIKIIINGRESIIKTAAPFPSNDCLLFQSWGLASGAMNRLLVENVDGARLDIDRFEFWRLPLFHQEPDKTARAVTIAFGATFSLVVVWAVLVTTLKHSRRAREVRQGFKVLFS
ncbi:unnamed protein product [Rhizoctonia solani]|uniref:Uncharacterized protein n=1 Tax=Rhizoctonia solani TaxID=456999 RepID=A0A8H3DLS6_9AGAM|nr:unnamed protein product [Rhizoctonia solani]